MNPEQAKVAIDVNATVRYLTNRIAVLEEQLALQIGKTAHAEALARQQAVGPEIPDTEK